MDNEDKYKVGDIVVFEQCWEDESGHYHDEAAEIIAIKDDRTLELNWLGVSDEVEKFLKTQEKSEPFTIDQIAYKQ